MSLRLLEEEVEEVEEEEEDTVALLAAPLGRGAGVEVGDAFPSDPSLSARTAFALQREKNVSAERK